MIQRRAPIQRKTRPRPMRDTDRARAIRENDHLVRQIVLFGRARCIGCGGHPHDPHHFRGRTLHTLRWDLRNVQAACRACHDHFPADPMFEQHAMIHAIGQRRFDELERDYVRLQSIPEKLTTEGIKARGDELRRILEDKLYGRA
jgi:hypothetical protein